MELGPNHALTVHLGVSRGPRTSLKPAAEVRATLVKVKNAELSGKFAFEHGVPVVEEELSVATPVRFANGRVAELVFSVDISATAERDKQPRRQPRPGDPVRVPDWEEILAAAMGLLVAAHVAPRRGAGPPPNRYIPKPAPSDRGTGFGSGGDGGIKELEE